MARTISQVIRHLISIDTANKKQYTYEDRVFLEYIRLATMQPAYIRNSLNGRLRNEFQASACHIYYSFDKGEITQNLKWIKEVKGRYNNKDKRVLEAYTLKYKKYHKERKI